MKVSGFIITYFANGFDTTGSTEYNGNKQPAFDGMLIVIATSLNQSGFVKRRCEADSRWLPPDFSECVSKDYQTLFDKVKQLSEKNRFVQLKEILVRSFTDRAVLGRAMAGDIALGSSAIQFTLTVPLSTQVYK